MRGPLELGNFVLIILGVVLLASGPLIVYKTVSGLLIRRRENPGESLHPFNNGLNILIGVLFFIWGILFIKNNLSGNIFASIQ